LGDPSLLNWAHIIFEHDAPALLEHEDTALGSVGSLALANHYRDVGALEELGRLGDAAVHTDAIRERRAEPELAAS
jgi:hypothetical protein